MVISKYCSPNYWGFSAAYTELYCTYGFIAYKAKDAKVSFKN